MQTEGVRKTDGKRESKREGVREEEGGKEGGGDREREEGGREAWKAVVAVHAHESRSESWSPPLIACTRM